MVYLISKYCYSCRRIKLMFDQMEKRKGMYETYVLLGKICCRQYNDPVKPPDAIEGKHINSTHSTAAY